MAKDTTSIKFTTPTGIAQFPWITTPDTRFNADGDYKVTLLLSEEAAAPVVAKLEKVWADYQATLTGAKTKKAPSSMGFDKEYTEDGDETGNVLFKIKTKAKFTKKDGSVVSRTVDCFDSEGQPFTPDNLWGGSKIKVNVSAMGYDAGGNLGVTLKMNAVQVIELNAGNGGNASSYGFGAEEDGYVAKTFKSATGETNGTTDGEVSDADDF